MNKTVSVAWTLSLVTLVFSSFQDVSAVTAVNPVVEIEEDLYSFLPPDNGSGPMWCSGSTSIVRCGDTVFATEIETLPDIPPLNNCRWKLHRRDPDGWKLVYTDNGNRTREPCPLATSHEGYVWVSANPTLVDPPQEGGGPARPELLRFNPTAKETTGPSKVFPEWSGAPSFTEHSYRSFAADGKTGDMILFQNIGYTHAEWAFHKGSSGEWQAAGQLKWPWGAEYDKPQPIRVCYPNVALKDQAVFFCGVSDIVEPYDEWREFKYSLTGQKWDYDFRRLFFTWTPDITSTPFSEWVEIASRDQTAGWIQPCDLWVDSQLYAHILWQERAIDERLREKFFPDAEQRYALNYALIREGRIILKKTLMEGKPGDPGTPLHRARFHADHEGDLYIVYYLDGKNLIQQMTTGGNLGDPVPIALEHPMQTFFTATPRAGSPESQWIDMLGISSDKPDTMRYVRIRLHP
jgi:hypothetical protein